MITTEVADLLRLVIFVLFGLTLGETALILRRYFSVLKKTRRLLPIHVSGVTLALLGLEFEAVWQNVLKIGTPPTWYIPVNLTLFTIAYTSLVAVRVHISRKRDVHCEILPLVQDPKEMD